MKKIYMYKVVQIWPGLIVCKQVTVCPGHIWTTLYICTLHRTLLDKVGSSSGFGVKSLNTYSCRRKVCAVASFLALPSPLSGYSVIHMRLTSLQLFVWLPTAVKPLLLICTQHITDIQRWFFALINITNKTQHCYFNMGRPKLQRQKLILQR
jgi:hypothetical protein